MSKQDETLDIVKRRDRDVAAREGKGEQVTILPRG